MKESFKILNKIISHPVISSVVAAIVVGIGIKLLGWWPKITKILVSAWQFILSPVSIPIWLLVLLSIASSVIVIVILIALLPRKAHSPSWPDYLSDEFYGIRWRCGYYEDGSLYAPYHSV